ncbi:hypothetical protein EFR01_59290 [Sinorhizobium fredii]|nr:hypothetical protein EFR01_59290 [Sinorhizobium fredii]GLS07431.1 hypothetical protein GCM10007864_10580 [Sinorhizobium fredii]
MDWRIEVLDPLWSKVFEMHREDSADILVGGCREAYQSRLSQSLHTGSDIYSVAEQVAIPDHCLSDMYANTEHYTSLVRNFRIYVGDFLLDVE